MNDFRNLFVGSDEKKTAVLAGLIEEAYDCKMEIRELKEKIEELKEKGAKFAVIAKREKLLIQKRASYTNMMAKLCRELCAVDASGIDDEGLEDYE